MDELKPKEKEFVENYIENGGNATQAIKDSKYKAKNDNSAGVLGHKQLRKVKIKKAIKSIADSIPDELLIEKHLALLNKQEVVTKNNVTSGEVDVIPTGEIDANAVKSGLDMAYKLKSSYAPEKRIIDLNTIGNLKPEELAIAKTSEAELNKLEDGTSTKEKENA